jgi:hypothetical protein
MLCLHYEMLDGCGMVDVRRAPIATEFCVAEKFRDVPRTLKWSIGVRNSDDGFSNQPTLCRLGFSAPQDLLRLIASTAPV